MRLIDTRTLRVREFTGSDVPAYAILSHTWGPAEASLGRWSARLARLRQARRPGFAKVLRACEVARHAGVPYLWADTVCIDRSSSAEVAEAINSMFAWYAAARVCYIYLADVSARHGGGGPASDEDDALDRMRHSRWFTRGWTLQELIAPPEAVLYSAEWEVLGTKRACAVRLAAITGIDADCLQHRQRVSEYSVAERMSWAAGRATTRAEDQAYALLGLFGISMPLLYGEGSRAFIRLQEEIIKASDDHSILAFDTNLSKSTLLAHDPALFRRDPGCRARILPNVKLTGPFAMTNAGLSMMTPLVRTLSPLLVFAVLNCVETVQVPEVRFYQLCLPLWGKNGRYMRARLPLCLLRKPFHDTDLGPSHNIVDLTTPIESAYLIAPFSRIYTAFGSELDAALRSLDPKSFHPGSTPTAGAMLSFPRGMSGYAVQAAHPAAALRPEVSLFAPDDPAFPAQPGGVIVFGHSGSNRPVALYVGLRLDPATRAFLVDWACRLVEVPEGQEASVSEFARLWAAKMQQDFWDGQIGVHGHFHHAGNTAVAAKSSFQTVPDESEGPTIRLVMVEVVFDAHELQSEWEGVELDKIPD